MLRICKEINSIFFLSIPFSHLDVIDTVEYSEDRIILSNITDRQTI